MKKIICALCVFLSFISKGFSITDTREYVDWKDYPNIVKIITSNSYGDTVLCTGTEIGKYVITSAQCVRQKEVTLYRNDGTSVSADLELIGKDKDWAILSLPEARNSKYEIYENIISNSGFLYGFGDLRILTDDELAKVREYLLENDVENPIAPLSIDEVSFILSQDIPNVGKIYGDGDRLKKTPCTNITSSDTGIGASCFWSSGNTGGGLIINDTQIIGIASSGNFMKQTNTFSVVKPIKEAIQQMDAETCDEKFISDIMRTKYNATTHKKIDNYYIFSNNQSAILTDLCGKILLRVSQMNGNNIQSIKQVGGRFIFTISPVQKFLLKCGIHNGLNDAIVSKCQIVEKQIVIVEGNNDDNREISLDGGKSFYNKKDNKQMIISLFTQQEIDDMPEDWKKCLGIQK